MSKNITDLSKEEIAIMFPVQLSSYKIEWKDIYEKERQYIVEALSNKIIRIAHFGSTAIPNLTAKNTIDILVEIAEADFLNEQIIESLKSLEYDYILQNEGQHQHMIFVKGYSAAGEKGQTFHIHMGPKQHPIWDRIFFRDYLIEKKAIAKAYEDLKLKLAEKYKYDRVGYRVAKTEFVIRTTEEAKKYYSKKCS
ncbi:MAG: GrpB family protein [Flavobacterium sp.]|nr:MAG: GrpB family protein [Flavobacterium sp.]